MKRISDAKVGDWYISCCYLDLGQIENEQDLADLKDFDDDMHYIVWDSKKEALEELLNAAITNNDDKEVKEIKEILEK